MSTSSEPDPRPTERAAGSAALGDAPADHPLGAIAARLLRLRGEARAALLASGIVWLFFAAIAFLVLTGSLDFVLRMPAWMRTILLLAALGAGAAGVIRWLLPAWRFHPNLTEVALRVERTREAREAGLEGVLASGLELADSRESATPAARWMSERVVEDAARRFDAVARVGFLKQNRNIVSLLLLAAAALTVAAFTWTAGSRLVGIGLARVLAPWSAAEWPRRTEVADATGLGVHPLGTALPLRAALLRSDTPPERARVAARYRVIAGGQDGTLQRTLLAPQGRPVFIERDSKAVSGDLFEQLVEPSALTAATPDERDLVLEYWFETSDHRTPPARVRLVEPPAVLGAAALVTPPAYAASGDARRFVAGSLDLGAGDDQRAVVGPVLAGSRVALDIRFNKPIPGPPADSEEARRDWLAAAIPGVDFGTDAAVAIDEDRWSIAWTIAQTTRVPVVARDEYGLTGRDETAFAFDVVEDRPPTAAVTLPAQDESVLAGAIIDAAGEGRDDAGIASLRLDAQAARPPAGSIGAAPEPAGEPAPITTGPPDMRDPTQVQVTGRLTLEAFDLKPRDELWITAVAADAYELTGVRHDSVRSAPRKLRIVTEEELIEQVRSELAGIREAAIRIDQDQSELVQAAARGFVSEEERRRQAGLGPRLQQQSDLAARLLDRAERNALDDSALTGLLKDVDELLEGARRAADRAGSLLDEAAQDSPSREHAELTPQQAQDTQRAQNEARDNLGKLIELLDRGEDGWAARRELQRLLERQRELEARTAAAGQRTVGRETEDLSPEERQELARLAEEQGRLAEQAERTLDNLAERSRQMREIDAAQSAAMNRAAQRGQQAQVPQRMQDAAQSAAQNQTGAARQQQQQAMEAMEEMLGDLENADRNRDESLRRLLSSVIESLDALIRQQELELAALGAARLGNRAFEGLDQGMIRLNQNTLGVLGESKAAFREMAKVAQLIEQAATAQASAVGALRAVPVDEETADRDEQASLRNLRMARAEAQKIQDEAAQRDQDRKRQELRRVYRDALEEQVVLRDETAPLLAREPDRRDRLKLRGFGERQETLRKTLDDLRRRTQELTDAAVFAFAHDQLDMVMAAAAKKLRAGQPAASIGRDQNSAIRILRSMVEALAENPNQNDEFRDSEGGGGEGGQGGAPPLIPDLAELRLLRGMQQQAAELTRALDDDRDTATPADVDALGRLQSDLAEQGDALIERLQQNQGGPSPEVPGGDRP